jgi:drug/metabolite transporter (DMT)-like permease
VTADVWTLVLAAAIGHALWNFAARRVSGNLIVLWFALTAGCLLLLPAVAFLISTRGLSALTTSIGYGYMLATGLIHVAYFLLLSRAYEQGEISLVYPVARGSGIGLTALLAWFLLGEQIPFIGAAGIGLVFAGILLMGAPGLRSGHTLHGFRTALWVGASIVTYSLVDKVGVSQVHPILYIWAMAMTTVIWLAPSMLGSRRAELRPTFEHYRRYIVFMSFGILGTYLMILFAFTRGPVSYIVAAREFSVVVGSVLGFVFMREGFHPTKIAAILAITAGIILIKLG